MTFGTQTAPCICRYTLYAPAPWSLRRIATGESSKSSIASPSPSSQSLSLGDVLTSLTRELVFGVERASEVRHLAVERGRGRAGRRRRLDGCTGPPAWPRGQEVNSLAAYPETRDLLQPRARGYREFRITDPTVKPDDREVLVHWGWRSSIELPLVVEGRSVGLIEVADYRSARRWTERDISFCQTIASQAAMAVRNAQLYEDLQRQADRDPLTDVLNHRAYYERLTQELARAHRAGSSGRRAGARPRRLQGDQRPSAATWPATGRCATRRPRSPARAACATWPAGWAATSSV